MTDTTFTLKPVRIGHLEIPTPAMLAALAGYSDLPYRRLCRRMGAGYCHTEVRLDTSINLSPKLRRQLVHLHAEDHPLAGQIMGCAPETMATAARHLVAMGCEVVDLNFACPVRKVLGRGRGGHMMRDPDTAIAMVRAVRAAVDVPVTVKLRRSFELSDTTCDNFWRIAEAAFDAGAAAICLHPRAVQQRYSGPADWEFLARARAQFADRTLIGSGDLWTAEDGLRMLAETGVDAVTFARGALGNPWIFRQFHQLAAGEPVTAPSLAEQRALLEEHYALSMEVYGPQRGPRMMYRFGIRYSHLHPTPKAVRQAFIESGGGPGFLAVLERFYA